MVPPSARDIEHDEVLTHYGLDNEFRTTPRWRIETDMSVLLEALDRRSRHG